MRRIEPKHDHLWLYLAALILLLVVYKFLGLVQNYFDPPTDRIHVEWNAPEYDEVPSHYNVYVDGKFRVRVIDPIVYVELTEGFHSITATAVYGHVESDPTGMIVWTMKTPGGRLVTRYGGSIYTTH